MNHSIRFDDKRSWEDWHLIPSSRPVFSPPPLKSKYVDIPGTDGHTDLTTLFSEFPTYGNRKGSFEFVVADGYASWDETYASIIQHLHGHDIRAVLDDDPNYFYKGRFTVNQLVSNKSYSSIVVDYDVEPYKKERIGAWEAWLWDPFDFENDYAPISSNLTVNGTLELTIDSEGVYTDLGWDRPIVPTFTSSSDMTVTFGGTIYTLKAGMSRIQAIQIQDGPNTFIFTGNGTITIDYAGRSL